MGVNTDLEKELRGFERDRGIKREDMLANIVDALQAAAKKSPFCSGDVSITINPATLAIRAVERLIVDSTAHGSAYISLEAARAIKPDAKIGDTIERPIDRRVFGRISAQMAKQALVQGIHASEREIMQKKYADKVGRIVTVTVRQIYHKDAFCDLEGGGEAILKSRDRMKNDRFTVGETIRAVIRFVGMEQDARRMDDEEAAAQGVRGERPRTKMVDESAGNPCVKLSRTDKLFVKALFLEQSAEMKDGTVEIVSIARQPGVRTKVAVRSNDPKVDAIGACVGVRGSRIHPIISELNGEKIDIVSWNENIAEFARAALSPARVVSVEVNPDTRQITALIDKDSLTPVIGKLGVNTRLASELVSTATGITWTISARELSSTVNAAAANEARQEKFRRELAAKIQTLSEQLGVDLETAETISQHGFLTPEGIVEVTLSDFITEMASDQTDEGQPQTTLTEEAARAVWAAAEAVLLGGTPASIPSLS